MKQIRYNYASNLLRLDYPEEWNPKTVSAVVVSITDRSGTGLLATSSATLYTATTLAANANRFADSIILASGATAPSIGDILLLIGAEGDERVRVKGYDTTTRTVYLADYLENNHLLGDTIYGCFATYTLSTTVTATFKLGLVVRVNWLANVDVPEVSELMQIADSALAMSGLRQTFVDLCPRYYHLLTTPDDRFEAVYQSAQRRVIGELLAEGLNAQRLADQALLLEAIVYRMAQIALIPADEQAKDEREILDLEYSKAIGILQKLPVWTDDDLDGAEGDGETTVNIPSFTTRNW